MASSITKESKNDKTLTKEAKTSNLTWVKAKFAWKDARGTWAFPRVSPTLETKNNASITKESKP